VNSIQVVLDPNHNSRLSQNVYEVDEKGGRRDEFVSLDLPDDEISKRAEKPKQIKEDFSLYKGSIAELVTVRWNDRKCQ